MLFSNLFMALSFLGTVQADDAPTGESPPAPEKPQPESPAPDKPETETPPEPTQSAAASPEAEAPAPGPEKRTFQTSGEMRFIGNIFPDFPVDNEGSMVGQCRVLDQRLRAAAELQMPSWKMETEWDLFSGQLVGDTWDIPDRADERHRERLSVVHPDSFRARKAKMSGRVGPVLLEGGITTSHWGLGMVANDGAHDPHFGRADFGDRVLRLRVVTMPLAQKDVPLYLVVAGDRVIADDMARWSEDQAAYQGITSLLWRHPEGHQAGIYGVYRLQNEADGERQTRAKMVDVFVETFGGLGSTDWDWLAGMEAAGIAGTTDRSLSYNEREALRIRSAGTTGYIGARGLDDNLSLLLRGGWASGDGNSDDDTVNDFSFDRDFDVGMVMYPEFWGAIEAGTHALLSDPEHGGQAPDGVDAVTTEGAFRRASFVQPVIDYQVHEWVNLRTGMVWSWATAPIAHPFISYRNGGIATNHLGEETEGYELGSEFDWAVTIGDQSRDTRVGTITPALVAQGGHLFLSENLAKTDDDVLSLWLLTGRVRW